MPDDQSDRWFAELNDQGSFDVWDESGIAHIAAVSTGLLPDPTGGQHARLIAMAPELLDACRMALNWLADPASTRYREETVGQIRAAIARATKGEDSNYA